jgi:hypothetical protein
MLILLNPRLLWSNVGTFNGDVKFQNYLHMYSSVISYAICHQTMQLAYSLLHLLA